MRHTRRSSKTTYAPHGPFPFRFVLLKQGLEDVDFFAAAQPEDVGLGEEALCVFGGCISSLLLFGRDRKDMEKGALLVLLLLPRGQER